MPNGFGLTKEELDFWAKGFESPTKEIETAFRIDLRRALEGAKSGWWMLSPKERVEQEQEIKPDYKGLETRLTEAKESVVAKYQNIIQIYQLETELEAGKIPEPFVNITEEFLRWSKRIAANTDEIDRIQDEISQIEYKMAEVGAPTIFTPVTTFFTNLQAMLGWREYVYYTETPHYYPELLGRRNELIDNLERISTDQAKAQVYASLCNILPVYIQQGKITTFEDLFSTADFTKLGINPDDPVVSRIWSEISGALLSTPEGVTSLGQEKFDYDEIIALLSEAPTATPVGIHQLSTLEIVKAFQFQAMPILPEGLSAKEALEIFGKAGIPEEVAAELEDLTNLTRLNEEMWNSLIAQQEGIKAGLEEARMPEMGVKDLLWQTLVQPGLTALDTFNLLYRGWIAPWAAWNYRTWVHHLGPLPGFRRREETDFDAIYEEALKTDDWWMAGSKAMSESSMGWTNRIMAEWILDPMTWLGLGIFTKITKPIPLLGKFVNLAETGWVKIWDKLIFDQIKRGGKLIGLTPMQTARAAAAKDFQNVAAYLVKAYGGKHYRQIPIEDARKLLVAARKYALFHPEDLGDMSLAGSALLRRAALGEADVTAMMGRLGSKYDVTADLIVNVNTLLSEITARGGGKAFTLRTAPPFLLRSLGIPETKVALMAARRELDSFFNSAIANSDRILTSAKNTPELLANVFGNTQRATWETLQSKAAHNLTMSGSMASIFSKVSWQTATFWRHTLDRWVVTPFARMYLAFGAYGPFNILEGFLKPALARINPFWKSWKVNPALKGQRTWAGVLKPMELETTIPRLEMAFETPRFSDIERMSPNLIKFRSILSGGPIGKFFIDKPGTIGGLQRWNYWDRMATRFLGTEEAPEIMSKLANTIDDLVRQLPDDYMKALNLTRGELKNELLSSAIAGPQVTRSFVDDIVSERIAKTKVSAQEALADRIAGGRTAEAVSKYTQIPYAIQDDIITKASDGRLWARGGQGIEEAIENSRAAMYDYFVHTPEFYAKKYTALAKDILDTPIATKEEFQEVLKMLQDMKNFYPESTDDVLRAAFELDRTMRSRMEYHAWNEWRASYLDDVHRQLQAYADAAQDSFSRMAKYIKAELGHLPTEQQAPVLRLFQSWTDEMLYTKNSVAKLREMQRTLLETKPKGKEEVAAFWDDYFSKTNRAWDDWRTGVAPLRSRSMVDDYIVSEALGISGPPPPIIDASARKLTKNDVAQLFHGHPSNLPSGALRLETMTLKRRDEFIQEVKVQAERMASKADKTADALGFTNDAIGEVYDYILRDMYMSPQAASVIEPRLMELASLRAELWSIYNSKGLPKGMAEDLQKFIANLADELEKVPGYATPTKPGVARGLSDDFSASKQRAADKASKEYYKDWADYTNENATTALMRSIYPFWTYELHRMFWIPRAAIRTPGVFKAWGAYMDYTEDGYFHIPGTSLEWNMLRGTIFMGGMIRLIRRDYPEFYDRYPGFSETMDYLSRFGFYPAAWVNFLKLTMWLSAGGYPMYGELLPAWIKTPLNAFVAAFPKSEPTKLLQDTILREVYRDYMTMLLANKICQEQQLEFNGRDIWDKKKTGVPLSEKEQEVWLAASGKLGLYGILLEQGGIFRIRTQNQLDAWEQSGKLIEEKTGYTQEEQFWIRQHGFRVGDYAQLDPLDQAVLAEMDIIKYHSGVMLSLMPSAWQVEDVIRSEFWGAVRKLDDEIRGEGKITVAGQVIIGQEQLDRLVREGSINMQQWDAGRAALRERYTIAFDELAATDRYANVPLSLEDIVDDKGNVTRKGLKTIAEERNMLPPVAHPAEEILNLYYSIRLEKKFDEETGKLIDDWDGYFLKIDAILAALSGDRREDLVEMITRKMSPLEQLRWRISREWFRPYQRRNQAILATQFTPEQQIIIREWIFASPVRRDELREIVIPETGNKLINTYQTMIRQAGLNLRMLNSELDAWLLFFEMTETTRTPAAQELYNRFRDEWGLQR